MPTRSDPWMAMLRLNSEVTEIIMGLFSMGILIGPWALHGPRTQLVTILEGPEFYKFSCLYNVLISQ